MGPHSFKCGKDLRLTVCFNLVMSLQWGRTLSSAESAEEQDSGAVVDVASMGPHSFKCGKARL